MDGKRREDTTARRGPNVLDKQQKQTGEKRLRDAMGGKSGADGSQKTNGTMKGVRWATWKEEGKKCEMQKGDKRVKWRQDTSGNKESLKGTGRGEERNNSEMTKVENTYQPRKTKSEKTCLDFRKLAKLQNRDPLNILIAIACPESGLEECLKNDKFSEDFIKVFLKCIAKACDCQSAFAKKNYMLDLIHDSTLIKSTLSKFALSLLQKRSCGENEEFKQHFRDVLRVVSEIARSCPISITSMSDVLLMLESVTKSLRDTSDLFDDELQEQLEYCCQLREKMLHQVHPMYGDDEPPGNFRNMSIFPEICEIKDTKIPFLRKNLQKGAFRNLEHYLDVQFRLLREDFIGPLRQGVNEYIIAVQQGNSNPHPDVRVYSDVKILCPIGTNNGLSHRISFDVSRMKHVNWESSKRLMFGSFVCLVSDNFKTLLFATVTRRDVNILQKGMLDVKFEGILSKRIFDFNKTYVMIESVAYFENYRHVLKGLQNFSKGDLPFEKHIIQCNTITQPPLYLRQNPGAVFDLRSLVEEEIILKNVQETDLKPLLLTKEFSPRSTFAQKIPPTGSWPSSELLHLDDSQYKALQRAMTSEFALIQGPPGTGKTYVALKIVKALLHNYKLWNTNPETHKIDHRPILVVCRTNHALDQFLVGIDSFFKGEILRVGGRSSNEVVQKYGLHTVRERLRKLGEMPSETHYDRLRARFQMMHIEKEITYLWNDLEVTNRNVLNENLLEPFMGRFYKDLTAAQCNSIHDDFETRTFILEWLGLGALAHDNEKSGCNKGLRQYPLKNGNVPVWDAGHHAADEASNTEIYIDKKEKDDEIMDNDEVDTLIAQKKTEKCIIADGKITQMEKSEHILQMRLTKNGNITVKVDSLNKYEDKRTRELTKREKKQLKKRMKKKINSPDRMDEEEISKIDDIWSLSQKDRWRLYRLWVHKFTEMTIANIQGKISDYQKVHDIYREKSLQGDKKVMERAIVLGMTTTCAAKYQPVLQNIGPRIIVAEEAAEVLEAHMITALNKNCQHLILIGDHQQLRPSPTVYKLEKEYNLGISLFERMIQNGIELDCLNLQHRMRPEISKNMSFIYPELEDHSVVATYEKVRGVSTNIFFINHNEPETSDKELRSHSNVHEALYIAGLCKYFILQGYKPNQITVLTMYLGQLFLLRRQLSKNIFEGVRITIVDNFQGEENDIILLSLVRHNQEGNIGFLKTDNRVCVALSRAKKGLYVIGNMDMMAGGSKLWSNIIAHAYKEEIIGNGLRLVCENHQDETGITVIRPEDFQKIQECNGSMKSCQFRLDCNDNSNLMREILDQNHNDIDGMDQCSSFGEEEELVDAFDEDTTQYVEPYQKILQRCRARTGSSDSCFMKKLSSTPLVCGHPCVDRYSRCPPCQNLCENHCSHSECLKICSEPCVPCQERCEWSCQHYKCNKLCFEPCDRPRCDKPCTKLLKCKHECIGMCGEKCPSLCRICDKKKVTEIFFGREDEPNSRFIELEDCDDIVEVNGMDVYMDQSPSDEKDKIILRDCPKCKTPIRMNLRYGNQIKKTLENIEKVKQKVLGNTTRLTELLQNIPEKISELQPCDAAKFRKKHKTIINMKDVVKGRKLNRVGVSTLWEEVLVAIHNQAILLKCVSNLSRMYQETVTMQLPEIKYVWEGARKQLEDFRLRILKSQNYFQSQWAVNAANEILRLTNLRNLLLYKERICRLNTNLEDDVKSQIDVAGRMLTDEGNFDELNQRTVKTFKNVIPGCETDISDERNVQIMQVLEMTKGNWFTCPIGHVYMRGCCVGVTMEEKCPECND